MEFSPVGEMGREQTNGHWLLGAMGATGRMEAQCAVRVQQWARLNLRASGGAALKLSLEGGGGV